MKDCRAKATGKPKAVKGADSLEVGSHAPAAADWHVELRDAGSLLRECYTLQHEDDFELNGDEFTGADWVAESEDEEYDESWAPAGGFPERTAARNVAPATGFVPSGPRSFPAEFAEESGPVINVYNDSKTQDPWAIDGDPWSASASSSASMAPTAHVSTSLCEQFTQMNAAYDASRIDVTQLLSGDDTVSREAASHPTDETGMSKHSQGGEWHSMATPSPPKAGGRWRAKETEVEPSLKQKRKARADIIRPRRPTPTRTHTHTHTRTRTVTHTKS